MDSSLILTLGRANFDMFWLMPRNWWNTSRMRLSSLTWGPMVMRPSIRIWEKRGIAFRKSSTSPSFKPNLVSSSAIFTWTRQGITRSMAAARFSISSAKCRLSKEWIIKILSTMYFTLLVWRWPIRCQRISEGRWGYFSKISCTLFSPKSRTPAS